MRTLRICILSCILCLLLAASALAEDGGVRAFGDPGSPGTEICIQQADGESFLFLPSTVSPDAVTLTFPGGSGVLTDAAGTGIPVTSGSPADLTSLSHEGSRWELTLKTASGTDRFTLMISANIASMYLSSENPEEQGREWVEASVTKQNRAKGSVVMLDENGKTVYDGELAQIRGRGNSTWFCEKRPYQIKLGRKADLLSTGDSANRSKTWCLIANYMDDSMIRNAVSLDMGLLLGLYDTPEYCFLDLYYDGEYRGVYILTEKVEVGSGRVDVRDLDDANEEANPDYDFDSPETVLGTTSFGTACQYVAGIEDPDDISGGWLIEFEYYSRLVNETSWWITAHGNNLYPKSPEAASETELNYIAELFQEFEDAVYAEGVNPENGNSYEDYVDLDSLARTYLILELSGGGEAYSSSTFFYLDAGSRVFRAGPLWDFDLCYPALSNAEKIRAGSANFGRELLEIPSFREKVCEILTQELLPLAEEFYADGGRIDGYLEMLKPASDMNFTLWPYTSYFGEPVGGYSMEETTAYIKNFLSVRSSFLNECFDPEARRFYDVRTTDWFYDYVEIMAAGGYLKGTTMFNFEPDAVLTRGQAVTILCRMFGADDPRGETPFPDVSERDFFSDAVAWAYANGIVTGESDGRFHPDDPVTKEQLITMCWKIAGSPTVKRSLLRSYSDGDRVHAYAAEACSWAVGRGILSGGTDGRLNPSESLKRCETAKILFFLITE